VVDAPFRLIELEAFEARPTRPFVHRARRLQHTRWWIPVAMLAGLAWSLWSAGVGRRQQLNTRGWPLTYKFLRAAADPEMSGSFLRSVGHATIVTIGYATLGTVLSVAFGGVFGILLSSAFWRTNMQRAEPTQRPLLLRIFRSALNIPRGIHEAVWGLLLLNILGADPWVAILAIAIPYGAITAKVYAELIDDTSWEVARALRSSGVSRFAALLYGVLPSTGRDLASYGFYRFECSLRAGVILGMIGAGGLGFQLTISSDGGAYGEMWTVLYVLIVLSLLAETLSTKLRNEPTSRNLKVAMISSLILFVVSIVGVKLRPWSLWAPKARNQLSDFASRAWPPRWPFQGWQALITATRETVELSFLAIVFATTLAIPVAVVGARRKRTAPGELRNLQNVVQRSVSVVVRGVAIVSRAIPPTVWALLVVFIVRPGILPGAIALGIYTFGVVTRLFLEVLENSDQRPRRALQLTGASSATTFTYGLLPDAAPKWAAYALYRWEVAARESVVVGVTAAGGLGRLLQDQKTSFDFPAMTTTIGALIIVTSFVDFISARLRASLR
jgi:phosphonate transport system permease protein